MGHTGRGGEVFGGAIPFQEGIVDTGKPHYRSRFTLQSDHPMPLDDLRRAALDQSPVSGLTHQFYRYPARFSPVFAREAIKLFSRAGDIVLDPYMGGGTAVIEAQIAGRQAVGCDLNQLAVFLTRVKTTTLTELEHESIQQWAEEVVPELRYTLQLPDLAEIMQDERTRNLQVPRARPLKKVLALALRLLDLLPSQHAEEFVRCALLNAGQWALNGRRRPVPLSQFRTQLQFLLRQMLDGVEELEHRMTANGLCNTHPILITGSASELPTCKLFSEGRLVDMVVTSPPYPGIHILYHRWQVDGRKESPAPFWLADCQDGQGASYYTFADRKRRVLDSYFEESVRTLRGIRKVMKPGAFIVQLIAFSSVNEQLPQYLQSMIEAGFAEFRTRFSSGSMLPRIWRLVPGRRWHAMSKGATPASREVVLVHRAV